MISKETLSLLRRLQSGIGRWPVNSSRKGRDLGGFLRTTYEQRFKELVKTDVGLGLERASIALKVCKLTSSPRLASEGGRSGEKSGAAGE